MIAAIITSVTIGISVGPLLALFLVEDELMLPNQKYLISENTVFEICDNRIDLSKGELKKKVENLRKNESFIIGRSTNTPKNFREKHQFGGIAFADFLAPKNSLKLMNFV